MRRFVVGFFSFLIAPLTAQQRYQGIAVDTSAVELRKFDESAIGIYKEQKEFDYRELTVNQDIDPSWLERFFDWLSRNFLRLLEWLFGIEQASGVLSFILQILPYAIGAIVLFLLIKFFLNRHTTDLISTAKNRSFKADSEDEELIRNTDLRTLLEESISSGNYRHAVRYYYLSLLKSLDKTQVILWEPQKTNLDFINEIKSADLKTAFEENTRLYDFVWYGEFGLTADEFATAEVDFRRTDTLINKQQS